MPISPKFQQMPKPDNKFLRLLADLVLPSDPADAAGDLVGPMMAAERVGGKVAKGLVGEAAENFKRWFGDSKAIKNNGEPLTLYHGSPDARDLYSEGFSTPMKKYKGEDANEAYFFTDNQKVANSYATEKMPWDSQNAEKAVIPTNLKMQNPKVIDWEGKRWEGTREQIQKAKKEGFDSIEIKNVIDDYNGKGKPSNVFVVFEPTQIKHATKNSGAYDPNDPSIMKSLLPYLMYGLKPNENE